MSHQVPCKLSPPVRFAPLDRRLPSRSPSRSPTRQARFAAHELDPLLSNLSPKSTLEALQATEAVPTNEHKVQDVLRKSIAQASTTERALGIRAALAAQKLREWYVELLSWDWPKDNTEEGRNGFQPPPKTDSVDHNEARKEHQENTVEEGYFGGLTATTLEHYEERIAEIRDALEALDVEELKEHVLNAHVHPRSRPSSQHGPSSPSTPSTLSTGTPTKLTYVQLRDFTAVITATILQALPFLARLTLLLTIWDARVAVSRRIPDLLEGIGTLRTNLDTAVCSIQPLGDTADRRTSFTRERYESIRVSLEEQVSTVGSQMDSLLDTLEGREDTLPQVWIDGLDAIENDFSYWAVQAESVVVENELMQVREAQLHAESVAAEEELKQVRDAKLQAEAEDATARELQAQDKPNADIVADLSADSRRSPHVQSDGSDDCIGPIASLEELSPTTPDVPVDIPNSIENLHASIDSVNVGGNIRGSFEGSETVLEASALKDEPVSNDMEVEHNEPYSGEAHESNRALHDKAESALQVYTSSPSNPNTGTGESDVFFGGDQIPGTDSRDMDSVIDPTLADIQRDLDPKQGMATEHNHLPGYQNKSYGSTISERHELLNEAIRTIDATSSSSSRSPEYFDSDNLEAGERRELSNSNSIEPSVLISAMANGNGDLEAGKHIDQPHLKKPIHLHESSAEANASITSSIPIDKEATSLAQHTKNKLPIHTQDTSAPLSPENSLHAMDEIKTEESSLRPKDGTSLIQETAEELSQPSSPQNEDTASTQDTSEANEISPALNLGALSQDDAYENPWITGVSQKPKDTNSLVEAIAHQSPPSLPSRNLHNLRLSSMPSYQEKRDILTPGSRNSDYLSDLSTPEIKEASTAEVLGTASPIIVASPARKLKRQPASPTTPSRNDSQRTVRPATVEIEPQGPQLRSHHNREPSLVVSESSFSESDETTESGLSDSEMTSVLKRASVAPIGHFTPRDIQSVEIRRSGSFSSYRHESPSRVLVSGTSHLRDQKLEDQFPLPPMSHPVLSAKESNYEPYSPSPPLPRRSSKRVSINSPTTVRTPISPDRQVVSSLTSSIPLPAPSPSKSPSLIRPSHSSKVSPAYKPTAKSTDDHLEQKISSILHTIPARIRLASRPSPSQNSQSPDPDSSSSSNRTTRSSTPTPSITLTPAFTRSSRPNHDTGDSSIRLYNLHTAGREGAPMKLHVRLVGERGERVMVRTGGGWADLGEWLRDYALHHGGRNLSDSKFQVESLPSTSPSTSLGYSGGKSSTSTPASTHSNRSVSYGNNNGRVTPGGFRDSVLKTRYPSPTSPIESPPLSNTVDWPPPVPSIPPALISRKPLPGSDPSTPTPTSYSVPTPTPNVQNSLRVKKPRSTSSSTPLGPFPNPNISNSPLVSTPSELTTSAPQTLRIASNPAPPNTTTGLAPGGPKTRIASLSAEKQAWIEGMMGAARKVSETNNLGAGKEKAKEKGKAVDRDGEKGGRRTSVGSKGAGEGFGDLGSVGGTRRIWLKGGLLKGKGIDRGGGGDGR